MKLFDNQQCLVNDFPELYFEFCEKLESTNDKCKLLCRDKQQKWVVIADSQSRGRGRYGRVWQSVAGMNIYISFAIENSFAANMIDLNFYLGTVLYETVASILPHRANSLTLKWPNDLYFGDKKLAGILIENIDNELRWLVVGMGINVYAQKNQIPETGTSLFVEGVTEKNMRYRIIEALLKKVYHHQPKASYRDEFYKYSKKTQSSFYTYTKHDEVYRGKLKEMHEDGSITIINENGDHIHLGAW